MHVCVHVYVLIYAHVYVHVHAHVYVLIYAHVYVHVYAHVYVHVYANVYVVIGLSLLSVDEFRSSEVLDGLVHELHRNRILALWT